MITKEQFMNYYNHFHSFLQRVKAVEELLGDGFGDTKLCEDAYWVFDLFMDTNFTNIGRDVFYDWYYEDIQEVDIDGVHYEFYSIEDLWNFLEGQRT